MNSYFNINYEFDKITIWRRIDEQLQNEGARYICVADGNILQMVHKDLEYRNVVNASMFSICDSSWVPLYLKRIYGIKYQPYCGSQIFEDLTGRKQYRQFFIGTSEKVLIGLKKELSKIDPSITLECVLIKPIIGNQKATPTPPASGRRSCVISQ